MAEKETITMTHHTSLIDCTLLELGWEPVPNAMNMWRKDGNAIVISSVVEELIDYIANKNHKLGWERGAYEQQQQEDVEPETHGAWEKSKDLIGPNAHTMVRKEDNPCVELLGSLDHMIAPGVVRRVEISQNADDIALLKETLQMHERCMQYGFFNSAAATRNLFSTISDSVCSKMYDREKSATEPTA